MVDEINIVIGNNGIIRTIYSDILMDLFAQGETKINRASYVEPCVNGWNADMSPVNGPVLGPFKTRTEALKEENDWLKKNNVPVVRNEI